mgnify:CR=1 FL=1
MEKLAVFKIGLENLVYCASFTNKEDAIKYLEYVKGLIDKDLQTQLQGEYIIVPSIYFNLK